MRIQELVVMGHDGVMRVGFHPRLTVMAGLEGSERDALLELVHRSMLGAVDHAELRYRDAAGRLLLIRRSGGRRRVAVAEHAGTSDTSVPGSEDLPRITLISSADLGMGESLNQPGLDREPPSVPQLVERMIGWLGRARNGGSRGTPSLAVLNEPLLGLDSRKTWDLLDAVERLSSMVQVVYLTNDATVTSWASQRSRTGSMQLTETSSLVH